MVCSAWRHAAFAGHAAGRMSRTLLNNKFDGDTCSFNVVYTENAKKEIKTLLDSRHYYVGVDGRMNFSADTDVISLVLASITGG